MRKFMNVMAIVIAEVFLFGSCALAETESFQNPLLYPQPITEYMKLPGSITNILLLGIDFGHKGYWGSGGKKSLENCHTDAVLVIAVNTDEKTADMISLPRDTLTYVPGVKGIYKLNAAINCGDSMEDGLCRISEAASWLMGGIQMDYYFAVDMNTMAALGDALDGVDFELEMSYTGHSGKKYRKGLHHLDGVGITDYMRSRTNATVNANDIGRTGRQRKLMLAIFQKLKTNPELVIKTVKAAQEMKDGFFTNIINEPVTETFRLLSIAMGMSEHSIGSYVLSGKYRTALNGWNFTFTDQQNRQTVIKEVYGVDVPPLQYVGFEYTKWLEDAGFRTVHVLSVADQLREYIAGYGKNGITAKQQEAIDAFEAAYQDAALAFVTAAHSMSKQDTKVMEGARKKLLESGDAAAKLCEYRVKLPWATGKLFYADPYINEVAVDWR